MTAPMFPTREEALAAPGLVYLHWKGGVYRLLSYVAEGQPAPDVLPMEEASPRQGPEPLVVYEHLWPHTHQYYVRPAREFFDHGAREEAEGVAGRRRFTPYTGGRVDVGRVDGAADEGQWR